MKTFAEIKDGVVVNMTVWEFETPQGDQFIETTDMPNVIIGCSYVGGNFIEPAQPEPETTLPESDTPNIEAQ
jgi:hypothetical protein